MQNNRNYGFNQYQPPSTPSRNQNDWNRETEWSTPDESWRGAERAPAIPYDTWKQRTPDPPRTNRDFQYGRDRAPSTVDDQFLVRLGAKRMNNGNLVDRDGFTLRTRDPQCSARFQPSPPSFNPRREFRRGRTPEFQAQFQRPKNVPEPKGKVEKPAKQAKTSEVNVLSQDELDKRAKQQIEMMKKLEKDEERKKRRREKELEENEGEDEYEEVETAPPPVVEPPNPQKMHLEAMKTVQNPVEKPDKEGKKQFKGYMEDEWFSEYQKRVEELKEQTYGNSSKPSTSAQIPAQTGYFFPSVPRSTSFSSPGAISTPPPPKPPQMDLPPPGIIPDSLFRRHVDLPPYQPPNLANIDAFGVPIGSKHVVVESSDSEEEDEAVKRLRDIIKNYGNPRN